MSYVDGFLIVLPKANIEAYKKMAEEGAAIWKKYGALDYKECLADDINPNMDMPDMPPMEMRPFPALVGLKDDETIVFSYIVYRDRAHRDEVNKAVMGDPAMSPEQMKNNPAPFDMKKFSYGGFQTVVEW